MSQSSNTNRIQKGSLAIDQQLYDFIENEVLPKVGVDSDDYWSGFEKVIKEFTPRNKALLATRDKIQAQIDQWHLDNPAKKMAKSIIQLIRHSCKKLVICYLKAKRLRLIPKTSMTKSRTSQGRSWSYQFVMLVMRLTRPTRVGVAYTMLCMVPMLSAVIMDKKRAVAIILLAVLLLSLTLKPS